MHRTQIRLSQDHYLALLQAARRDGLSMSGLVRKLVDQQLRGATEKRNLSKDAIMAFVGLGASGRSDISERHDEALAEFFRSDAALDRVPDGSDTST
jgi:predicted DNA-binding ribbon-helix-helix protein